MVSRAKRERVALLRRHERKAARARADKIDADLARVIIGGGSIEHLLNPLEASTRDINQGSSPEAQAEDLRQYADDGRYWQNERAREERVELSRDDNRLGHPTVGRREIAVYKWARTCIADGSFPDLDSAYALYLDEEPAPVEREVLSYFQPEGIDPGFRKERPDVSVWNNYLHAGGGQPLEPQELGGGIRLIDLPNGGGIFEIEQNNPWYATVHDDFSEKVPYKRSDVDLVPSAKDELPFGCTVEDLGRRDFSYFFLKLSGPDNINGVVDPANVQNDAELLGLERAVIYAPPSTKIIEQNNSGDLATGEPLRFDL